MPAPNEFKVGPPSPVMPTSTSGGVGIHPHARIPLWRGHASSKSSPRLKSKAKPQVKPKAKGLFQDAELRVQSQARSTRRRVEASQLDSLTEMSWTVESVVTHRHCVMPHLNIDQSVARSNRSRQKHKNEVCWAECYLAIVGPRVDTSLRGAEAGRREGEGEPRTLIPPYGF